MAHKGKKKRVRTRQFGSCSHKHGICKADECTLCILCCDNPEHNTKSTELPAKRQRLARTCATMQEGGYKVPTENKFEFEGTPKHAGRPREETLFEKLQQTLTSTLESTPLLQQQRCVRLSAAHLQQKRYRKAWQSTLRSVISGIINDLAEDADAVDELRGMCANLFAFELAPIRESLCAVDQLADIVVRTRSKSEGHSTKRSLLVACGSNVDIANVALERAHERATRDKDFCVSAGGDWHYYHSRAMKMIIQKNSSSTVAHTTVQYSSTVISTYSQYCIQVLQYTIYKYICPTFDDDFLW